MIMFDEGSSVFEVSIKSVGKPSDKSGSGEKTVWRYSIENLLRVSQHWIDLCICVCVWKRTYTLEYVSYFIIHTENRVVRTDGYLYKTRSCTMATFYTHTSVNGRTRALLDTDRIRCTKTANNHVASALVSTDPIPGWKKKSQIFVFFDENSFLLICDQRTRVAW